MADYDEDVAPAPGEAPEPLQEWLGSAPPEFRDHAAGMAAKLNDYLHRRDLADASRAAGNALVAQLEGVASDFAGMVAADPAAFDIARDLARDATALLVGTLPDGTPDRQEEIARDIDRELARSAVNSLAERDAGAARSMLERVRGYLPADEVEALGGYIGVMDKARQLDNQAQEIAAAEQRAQREDDTAWNYLAAIANPAGGVMFKPGWAQRVLADPALPPDTSAALISTHARLVEQGDAPASDPFLVRDVLLDIADGNARAPDALRYAGEDMRLADALTVAALANDPARAAAVVDVLDLAGRHLATFENGPAGEAAYERFVNWLLPAVRGGAVLDPNSKDYLLAGGRLQQFAPRPSDNVGAIVGEPAERRPLAEIFGGKRG